MHVACSKKADEVMNLVENILVQLKEREKERERERERERWGKVFQDFRELSLGRERYFSYSQCVQSTNTSD